MWQLSRQNIGRQKQKSDKSIHTVKKKRSPAGTQTLDLVYIWFTNKPILVFICKFVGKIANGKKYSSRLQDTQVYIELNTEVKLHFAYTSKI